MKFFLGVALLYNFFVQSAQNLPTANLACKCDKLKQNESDFEKNLVSLILMLDVVLQQQRLQQNSIDQLAMNPNCNDMPNLSIAPSSLLQRRQQKLAENNQSLQQVQLNVDQLKTPLNLIDLNFVKIYLPRCKLGYEEPDRELGFQGSDLLGAYIFYNPEGFLNAYGSQDPIFRIYVAVSRKLKHVKEYSIAVQFVDQNSVHKEDRIVTFRYNRKGILEGYSSSNRQSSVAQSLKMDKQPNSVT
ncbi:hypothetical protein KBB68_00585 [Candidatus Babeliales bacterium]|nr:hypothetical protein [Candidatus Babeliales bacterium]